MKKMLLAGCALAMGATGLLATPGNNQGKEGKNENKTEKAAPRNTDELNGKGRTTADKPAAGAPSRSRSPDKPEKTALSSPGKEAKDAGTARAGHGNSDAQKPRSAAANADDRGKQHTPSPARNEAASNTAISQDKDISRGPGKGQSKEKSSATVSRRLPAESEWRGKDYAARRRLVAASLPNNGQINGCPPALQAKYDGCLPPQASEQAASPPRYLNWFPSHRSGDYTVHDGYLLQYGSQGGSVLSYLPLLGGALSVGETWPDAYTSQPLPPYYLDYYAYDSGYDYRYADHVVYQLDPQDQSINAIVGLLAGDDWMIGQPMPTGYDVYNLPYSYRDEYRDGPDNWYRYSDGYVYRVDPTSQLVRAVIDLVT